MRPFWHRWPAVWLAVACLLTAGKLSADNRRGASFETGAPNLVVLLLDDQAYSAMNALAGTQAQTPHMDRLAEEGVLFTRHYNSTAICMASRASLMMGQFEYRTGCNFMHGPLRKLQFENSYPVRLRKAGYRTGFAGKFGFAVADDDRWNDNQWDRLPVDAFDSWAGGLGQTSYQTSQNRYLQPFAEVYPHSTRAYGAYAQQFIRESVERDQKFCLTVFFKAPHFPQTPDPFFDDVFEGVTFALPPNHGTAAGVHLAPQSRMGRQYLDLYKRFGFDEAGYQTAIRKYYQLVFGVDYALGMIREELQRQRVADNTVIILTSDNGYFCGSHGFGGKVLLYEEGVKVPLIVMDPRLPNPGRRCQQLTATVDIAPTVMDLAGVALPEDLDGHSLRPLLAGTETGWRTELPLFQMWGPPATWSMGVVTLTHKYIYWCYGDQISPAHELFDLAHDPLEMHNVFDQPDQLEMRNRLQAQYQSWLARLKRDTVADRHYSEFGTILDPAYDWRFKKELIPAPFRK